MDLGSLVLESMFLTFFKNIALQEERRKSQQKSLRSKITSMTFSFLICKKKIKIVCASQGCCEDKSLIMLEKYISQCLSSSSHLIDSSYSYYFLDYCNTFLTVLIPLSPAAPPPALNPNKTTSSHIPIYLYVVVPL